MRTLVSLILAGMVLGGCAFGSKESTTVVGPDGSKVTVDENDGGATVTSGDTKAVIGGEAALTEEGLGVAFYPGSTEMPNASMRVDSPTETTAFSARTTPDDIDKVKAFYESKVPGIQFTVIDGPDGKSAVGSGKLPDQTSVTVTAHRKSGSDVTEISIGTGKKK